jgi:hypothetical protein
VADEDALSRGETVGLDHTRGSGDRHRSGGGNAGGLHDLLRERLRAFDPGCGGARPEDRDPHVPELVGDARDERCFGPDDHEVGIE